jgi:6-phosphofructokinase
VMGRDCSDLALTVCGAPIRYRIRRQITLDSE